MPTQKNAPLPFITLSSADTHSQIILWNNQTPPPQTLKKVK